jgi:hypothetical protein
MKNIGFFINNTITKKNIDINIHNIKTLHNNFEEVYIIDERNDYSEILSIKLKALRNKKTFKFTSGLNIFQKINKLLTDVNLDNIECISIILDDHIYLTNLKDYFDFSFKSKYDLISFTDSTELFYHLQFNILTIKKESINFFKTLISDFSLKKKNMDYNLLYLDFLKEVSTKISNKTAFCKTAYIESVENKNIYLSNSEYYYYLLEINILPIINITFLENLIKEFDKKEFVHKKLPIDFDIDIYKSYKDLKSFDEQFLKKHFIEYGQFECRKYKKNEIILPKPIYDKINKIKLIKYFDFPENFDFFLYKDKNDDLKKLNKLDLKKHWLNYGVYEERDYN